MPFRADSITWIEILPLNRVAKSPRPLHGGPRLLSAALRRQSDRHFVHLQCNEALLSRSNVADSTTLTLRTGRSSALIQAAAAPNSNQLLIDQLAITLLTHHRADDVEPDLPIGEPRSIRRRRPAADALSSLIST